MKATRPEFWLHAAAGSLLALTLSTPFTTATALAQPPPAKTDAARPSHDVLLEPAELQSLLPSSVFFKGQSAPLQIRNAGGIHFSDGAYLFASLVDTSGYSSGVQEKYQAYLVTEVPLRLGDQKLPPGAYGVGFIADNKFLVMDIGGHDLFTVNSTRDDTLKHPTPLRLAPDSAPESYRLYAGRNYVSYSRSN